MSDPTAGVVKRALTEILGFYFERRVENADYYMKEEDGVLIGATTVPHQDNRYIRPRELEAIAFEALDGDNRAEAARKLREAIAKIESPGG